MLRYRSLPRARNDATISDVFDPPSPNELTALGFVVQLRDDGELERRGKGALRVLGSEASMAAARRSRLYRRMLERLTTDAHGEGALRAIVDRWIYEIGEEVVRLKGVGEDHPDFAGFVEKRLEEKLLQLSTKH